MAKTRIIGVLHADYPRFLINGKNKPGIAKLTQSAIPVLDGPIPEVPTDAQMSQFRTAIIERYCDAFDKNYPESCQQ